MVWQNKENNWLHFKLANTSSSLLCNFPPISNIPLVLTNHQCKPARVSVSSITVFLRRSMSNNPPSSGKRLTSYKQLLMSHIVVQQAPPVAAVSQPEANIHCVVTASQTSVNEATDHLLALCPTLKLGRRKMPGPTDATTFPWLKQLEYCHHQSGC